VARFDHSPERYLREARLVARADGGADLHALDWGPEGEAHRVFALDAAGEAIGERVLHRAGAIALLGHDAARPEPEDAPDADDRARDGDWSVVLEREGPLCRVVALHGGRRAVVWEAAAIAAAPAIRAAEGGAWIAFHHDLREDRGEPDVTKWIALRHVDASLAVRAPVAPMIDRDRDRQGEEQGFELPSLAVGADGAVALFGRGSHRFFRQDVGGSGFSPRVPLGDEGWGCRGRRVAVCVLADGALLTARREKTGLVVERAPPPTGGPPALEPAEVRPPARPRPGPRRPAGPDPAARWSRRTLFGDIHQHSAHSDGCGTADEPYLRARWGYGDDFAALSDHESFLGKRIGPGEWGHLQAVAERHDEPGRFATLLAYEWTGRKYPGPGHKVVYAPAPGLPIVSRDRVSEGAPLLAELRALGAIAVPHHVGWTGADEEAHDPALQPVWEICSCHGCYLHAGHPLGARGELRDQMVEEVLRRGKRFGFIACSDGHGLLFHHGVARKRDPFRTGLTAVQATDCTRAAILEAIRQRRCYATSGVPILLDLVADGRHPMGSELRSSGPVRLEARATGTAPIASISLVTASGALATAGGRGPDAEVAGELAGGWAYAKVIQEDGEMAWSSPVFVDPA